MDLSAAVDATYMVQFTNAGMYILDKTTGAVADAVGLWTFWCSGTGVSGAQLSDCPSSPPTSGLAGFDMQIAARPPRAALACTRAACLH